MLFSADIILRASKCLRLAGINGSKMSYWIASGVYWSAVLFTNPLVTITGPLYSLQIRGVIYQTAGVRYWSAEKIKMLKTNPKKKKKNPGSSRYNALTFYEKKSHFTIPLSMFFPLYSSYLLQVHFTSCNLRLNQFINFLIPYANFFKVRQKNAKNPPIAICLLYIWQISRKLAYGIR